MAPLLAYAHQEDTEDGRWRRARPRPRHRQRVSPTAALPALSGGLPFRAPPVQRRARRGLPGVGLRFLRMCRYGRVRRGRHHRGSSGGGALRDQGAPGGLTRAPLGSSISAGGRPRSQVAPRARRCTAPGDGSSGPSPFLGPQPGPAYPLSRAPPTPSAGPAAGRDERYSGEGDHDTGVLHRAHALTVHAEREQHRHRGIEGGQHRRHADQT